MGPQDYNLDRYSTEELYEMRLDYYRQAMQQFEEAERQNCIMIGLPYPSAAYDVAKMFFREAMAAGTATHELFRAITAAIDARRVNADA